MDGLSEDLKKASAACIEGDSAEIHCHFPRSVKPATPVRVVYTSSFPSAQIKATCSTPRSAHSLHQATSKRIHKLRILPIRQIQPLLVLQLHILRLRSQQHFLRVLSLAVPVDEQHVQQAHGPARDDGDLGGDVAGRVAGAEGLGADDVADAGWGLVGGFFGG